MGLKRATSTEPHFEPIKGTRYHLYVPHYDTKRIKIVEDFYKAKYVISHSFGEIYYQETPHPEGSNYFLLYQHYNGITRETKNLIMDGKPILDKGIDGVVCNDGITVIYSAERHDYVSSPNLKDSNFIDGGQEYCRYNAGATLIRIGVSGPDLILMK